MNEIVEKLIRIGAVEANSIRPYYKYPQCSRVCSAWAYAIRPYTIILFFFATNLFAQTFPEKVKAFVSDSGRIKNRQAITQEIIWKTLQTPPENDSTEVLWEKAFWGLEVSLFSPDSVFWKLKTAFNHYPKRSNSFQRSLWEAIYTLYPSQFEQEALRWLGQEDFPRTFAMLAVYLHQIESSDRRANHIRAALFRQFPEWKSNPILLSLYNYLKFKPLRQSSIVELLAWQKTHGKKVIYSFQRLNRDFSGLVFVQNADGSLVKDSTGKVIMIQHLARSISNLPYFLTNGNAPQGVYSIRYQANSQNIYIGPTPTLWSFLPYEIDAKSFFHDCQEGDWTLEKYLSLLPPSWRTHPGSTEAFWAGKAGRNEIILHGTTIDPDYYKGKIYYPMTPSMGCLTTKEIWNGTTGTLQYSGQQALLNAYNNTAGEEGFLYVIELSNENRPVRTDDLEEHIKYFEKVFR